MTIKFETRKKVAQKKKEEPEKPSGEEPKGEESKGEKPKGEESKGEEPKGEEKKPTGEEVKEEFDRPNEKVRFIPFLNNCMDFSKRKEPVTSDNSKTRKKRVAPKS